MRTEWHIANIGKENYSSFPENNLLEFIATDIFKALSGTVNRSQYVVVMNFRYPKLKSAVPASNTLSS